MTTAPSIPRLALIGATGAVGGQFLRVLEHTGFRYQSVDLVASARSAGKTLTVGDNDITVVDVDSYDFSQCDIAVFTAGSAVSKQHGRLAAAAGCVVIDNTSFFRMDDDVPLVVPQLNGELIANAPPGTIIANPNCSTIQIVKVMEPIRQLFGMADAVISTYQAASGAGQAAVDEMFAHSASSDPVGQSDYFVAPLAFNVVPVIDELYDNHWTKEELKIVNESRKILRAPDLRITATTVRVPVAVGHSAAMFIRTKKPADRDALLARLAENDEIISCTDHIPTPRFIDQRDKVYVGRVRVDPDDPHGLWTWVVADNLWVGAAYNAVQIAQRVTGQA